MRVLVAVVDGLQAAALGCYGIESASTPGLDAWAAAGVVFDCHFSDCPEPVAARRAWRTGRHQHAAALPSPPGDLFADLRQAGVRVGRVGPAPSAESAFNGCWDIETVSPDDPFGDDFKGLRKAVRQATQRLGDVSSALLWIEAASLLPPWTLSDEFLADHFADDPSAADEDDEPDEEGQAGIVLPWEGSAPGRVAPDDDVTFQRLRRTYAAAVSGIDIAIAQLRKDCAKVGWADDAVWVLTSDTGLALGMHGVVGRSGVSMHAELVHLPLLVRWPGDEHAGLRVAALTQPPDVSATLREVFGLSPAAEGRVGDGRGLVALGRGARAPTRMHAFSGAGADWSVRTREWCLLGSDRSDEPGLARQLYVKPDDRWEFNDVAQHHAETVAELEREYRQWQKAT